MSRPVTPERCILLVEDDASLRAMMSMFLEDEGYNVQTARNGAEALVKVSARPPDAILLDLHLPVRDGRGFISAWKKQPFAHTTPILVMSAAYNQLHADDLGVHGYLPKPFRLDSLLCELQGMFAAPRVSTKQPA